MKYAFTNCTVLDGTKNMTPKEKMTVVVSGDRIEKICKTADFDSSGIKTYDLGGKYLMPGLIDLHVHLPGTGKPVSVSALPKNDGSKQSAFQKWFGKSLENGIAHKVLLSIVKSSLTAKLASGVTTVRSVGELNWSDTECRNMINSGKFLGPHLLTSGIGVSVPSGHMAGTMAFVCKNEEECRKAVDKAVLHDVDWIKLFVTGGVLDASENGEPAALRMSLELAKATCDEAHAKGFKTAAHAESTEGVRLSLKAGVDSIEHGSRMDGEIISLFKEHGSTLTVTISPAIAIAKLPCSVTGLDQTAKDASIYVMDNMIEGAKQALENDIPVGLGTDASCPYVTQYDFWREVYYFTKLCGASNALALHTATLKNAQILGLGNETGSIEEGKRADLIVTKDNPLDDIKVLRRVETVVVGGKVINQPKVKKIAKVEQALDSIIDELEK